ncbi:TPR_REGION domain-containing protein [Rubrivivax sp. A210]|uniref:O-linked N-acetylglucosamine transferase, SPINDLY family protein n=1 Tax=Rubrivivax sp. A210 TaxID=2772301 RepID=UPI0019180261|nr:hypothetical protein [Rubrivivax sp. A210]CAD5373634.1 TPR_REGION domain-containing protein [Rubrivivax sp. A210]
MNAASPREQRALHGADTAAAAARLWRAGLKQGEAGRWREAALAFARAARLAPGDALYWTNLAHAQRHRGALTRAVASARRALAIDAVDPTALRIAGDCLQRLRRYEAAAACFGALEAAGIQDAEMMVQHGAVLLSLLRPGEAAEVLLRALPLKPDAPMGHALLSDACRDQGRKREAVECMRTVLALRPGDLQTLARMSFEKRNLLDWQELDADLAQLRELLRGPQPEPGRIGAVFAMLSLPLEPELLLTAARSEARFMGSGSQPLPAVPVPVPPPQRRTRLGWLSYDFRDHAVSQLLVEVLEHIDRERFELFLYSTGPDDGSTLRARLEACEHFVDLRGTSDEQAAARIRADGVDVLVDLMGHTRGNRMAILAQRPAPVQVGFLGYPGSSGADYIDYFIGDPLTTPLELAPHFSEKLAQMPLCFQPNGRWRPLPQPMSRAAAGLPEDAFVMCAFNHTYKILPPAFDIWCAVMREVPRAVLWLKETNDQLRDTVLAAARARGVEPARIVFARNVRYDEHFSRLAQADVFVDTWPYNAHTTAADALWAGVPVITVYGNGFASRVAASALNAVGLAELAFADPEDYHRAILALALEPALLAAYRQHLDGQRMALPLFDPARHAGDLQALLQRMVERWRAGQEPDHLLAD